MKYKPIYIKLEEYEKISGVLETLKKKVGDTKAKLQKVYELKASEEQGLKELSERTNAMIQRLGEIENNLNSD
jgi:hypothetical protein